MYCGVSKWYLCVGVRQADIVGMRAVCNVGG